MMSQPTLFLTVGLPCTGKTTAARRIEIEQKALRLTKDEWVKALRARESTVGYGRDRGTAHPDWAARPRTRQQRRDRLRPLGPGRALRSTAGSSRPRRDGGDALLRTHPSRAAETT